MSVVDNNVQPFILLQSRSKQRVPVVVIFSHMDSFRTREQKEVFKKRMLNWISYHTLLKVRVMLHHP